MRRFIIDHQDVSSGQIRLTESEARHAAKVLRLKADDNVILVDGKGQEYVARVIAIQRGQVDLEIIDHHSGLTESPLQFTLGLGLLKADKMDHVVQKATELGLTALIPIKTDRSTIRLSGERAENRVERWRKISRQALKQCRRSQPVDIAPVTHMMEFLEITSRFELKILLHPRLPGLTPPFWTEILAAEPPIRSVAALVGPEGGFSDNEAAEAERAGFQIMPFGPRILRSETAAVALIAVLGFELGDLINFS